MKLNINIPATPKRTKILAAFMAFLIFALTFQEAFVGWNFGMRVSALTPGNGDIHSTSANKTSKYTDRMNENRTGTNNHGSTGSTFTYTGKYVNNNTTTLFDYLTDREIAGTYNDCWQKEEGYVDPFTTFNNAISGNLVSPADQNITIIIESHYTSSSNVTMYSEDNNGNHGVGWPGKSMTYVGGSKSAWKYVISTTDSTYVGFTPTKIKFRGDNGVKIMPGSGTDDYYRCT